MSRSVITVLALRIVQYVTTETKTGRRVFSTLSTVLLFVKVDQESCSSVNREQEAKTNKRQGLSASISDCKRGPYGSYRIASYTTRRPMDKSKLVRKKALRSHQQAFFLYVDTNK
jgi:hypothetical protein